MIWRWMRAVITGLACFFPGFVFSLVFTIPWADWQYSGDAQAALGALGLSFYIGVVSAIVGLSYYLRKAYTQDRPQ